MHPQSNDLQRIDRAYRVIGVRPDTSAFRIKREYRRLAKMWHPDKWPLGSLQNQHAGERMREINDAFRLIQHAPLRYGFETQAKVTIRANNSQQPPVHRAASIINQFEYIIRIMAGVIFGCFVSFVLILSDMPLPVAVVLPLLTAAASAVYGDSFWRWVLKYLWLWAP